MDEQQQTKVALFKAAKTLLRRRPLLLLILTVEAAFLLRFLLSVIESFTALHFGMDEFDLYATFRSEIYLDLSLFALCIPLAIFGAAYRKVHRERLDRESQEDMEQLDRAIERAMDEAGRRKWWMNFIP